MYTKSGKFGWVLAALLALFMLVPNVSAEEDQPSEKRVAEVNGQAITQATFDKQMARVQQQVQLTGRQLDEAQLSEVKKEVLENLIDDELLLQESRSKEIKIDDAAVEAKVNALKERFPSEADFEKVLSQMNLTEEQLKAQFQRQMAVEQLIDAEVVQKITVSEEEQKTYYDENPDLFKQPEQVRARHILVKVDAQADEAQKAEAKKKIEDIQKKLKEGGDFAALAKEFSDCPSSAQGGDLGFFRRGQMVKPFDDAAFALKPGERSDIVETNFGYHIIEVTDKKSETMLSYDEIKDRLENYLKQQKVQKEVPIYVESLKGKAKIERFLSEPPKEEPTKEESPKE
ncbi:MAG: peptidylprolyl isomerase [Candidatus Abyssobacteria bacterium SURF_17]|uniref:Peptidylprolyl isomerase n=1 Tax=Candidatus Abyssobacteria bacterium SURF_17 TaxID=2093361 RepID=A0A419EU93_9BACT|nr:MAG: peptidylprolyl isomerase [Candidatus Abyssubacteria bacterium SURF_17]